MEIKPVVVDRIHSWPLKQSSERFFFLISDSSNKWNFETPKYWEMKDWTAAVKIEALKWWMLKRNLLKVIYFIQNII